MEFGSIFATSWQMLPAANVVASGGSFTGQDLELDFCRFFVEALKGFMVELGNRPDGQSGEFPDVYLRSASLGCRIFY